MPPTLYMCTLMGQSRGGIGGPDPLPPLKIYNNMGFLSNTGSESPENQKATKPAALFGNHWPASETSFK